MIVKDLTTNTTKSLLDKLRPWWILGVDVLMLTAGFWLGYYMRYTLKWFREVDYPAQLADYYPILVVFIFAFLLMFWVDHIYRMLRTSGWFNQAYAILNASAKATIVTLAVVFFYRPLVYSRLMIMQASIIAVVLILLVRLIYTLMRRARYRAGEGMQNVLIVGAGEIGKATMRVLVARPELGRRCIGFVDDDPQRGNTSIGRFPALGSLDTLPALLRERRVDEMVITLPWSAQNKINELVDLCAAYHVRPRIAPSLLQMNFANVDVDDFGGIPMLSTKERQIGPADELIKRMIDIVVSIAVLIIALPIVFVVAILIRLESPGSPIFSQNRIGKDGKSFVMYKLRSMRISAEKEKESLYKHNEADGPLFKIREDPRVTRIGRFIRRVSIDELLQFLNVLKGDMSVVGPRPHLPNEVAKYEEWHKQRLKVKPGITGLSQISGRSELAFDETALLDIYYVENWTPSMDIRILLRTLPYLMSPKGAY